LPNYFYTEVYGAVKVYEFGEKGNPVLLLLPGTCCSWRSFEGVIPGLVKAGFFVGAVSYDGFDETEDGVFSSMEDEAEKLETYIRRNHGGAIRGVYGCSLGGTLVGLLAARGKVSIAFGIIGSSDFDTAGKLLAQMETKLVANIMYPMVTTGKMKGFMGRRMDKKLAEADEYTQKLMGMFGEPRPFVKKESIANQFYTDLITVLPDKLERPGMELHVFYAKKMGEKYRARYEKYIKHPIIHEDDLRHEELLVSYPEEWIRRVADICG